MNKKSPMTKLTLKDFQTSFPIDDSCLEFHSLEAILSKELIALSAGKNTLFHHDNGKKSYTCEDCGHHLSPTAGTIFHKSPTPLTIWFYVIYLMAQTRGGISAKQIQRETGVTYKCAWRMCKQVRSMLSEDYNHVHWQR